MKQIYKGMENGPEAINENFEGIFPVGAIYTSIDSTNPSRFLHGTWESFGAGRMLVGVDPSDSDFSAGATGGEKEHVLTVREMPAHTHEFAGMTINNYVKKEANAEQIYGSKQVASATTKSTGGGQAHNNMPPYIAVYMWVRTA